MRIKGIGSVGVMAVALVLGMPAKAQTASAPVALSNDEVTWHLRAGLNVAALACREQGVQLLAAYNAMLGNARVPLATAAAGTEAHYRERYGAVWQARNDADMTRLYNFFATPAAHARFCATARVLLDQAARVEPGDFYAFANAALPQLEQAFLQADDTPPAYAIATNARMPLAPVPREVAMRVAAEAPPADASYAEASPPAAYAEARNETAARGPYSDAPSSYAPPRYSAPNDAEHDAPLPAMRGPVSDDEVR